MKRKEVRSARYVLVDRETQYTLHKRTIKWKLCFFNNDYIKVYFWGPVLSLPKALFKDT